MLDAFRNKSVQVKCLWILTKIKLLEIAEVQNNAICEADDVIPNITDHSDDSTLYRVFFLQKSSEYNGLLNIEYWPCTFVSTSESEKKVTEK